LARSVEARLGRAVFADTQAELALRVDFSRFEREWRAQVSVADAAGALGQRELTTAAKHCSALDDSLALVVALLVDAPPQPPRRPPPSAAAPAQPTPAATTPLALPRETYAPRAPWTVGVRALAHAGLGLLPGLAVGAELGFGLRAPEGPLLILFVQHDLPRTQREEPGQRGVRLFLQRAGLDVCPWSPDFGRVRLDVCAGQRLGRIVATGVGFEENARVQRVSLSLVLGGDARWPLSENWRILTGVRLEVPLLRPRFAAGNEGPTLYQAPWLAGIASVGLEFETGS
ncbi:MAG TPA: hypothetical protein VMF89_08645, partial [Polyangiales bacterium]|nr:hypothetical protein [Polyangiales bacterium]